MNQANTVKTYVDDRFGKFGVNKKREISRLLFEIAKRDKISIDQIISLKDERYPYAILRKHLLKKRYPNSYKDQKQLNVFLSDLDIDDQLKVTLKQPQIELQNAFIEEAVQDTPFVERLKERYPNAHFKVISTYKEHTKNQNYGIKEYNNRLKSFYFIKEQYDFFKSCACSTKSVHCGYHVVNLGSGCAFECEYCYLQDYINSPGIILPANIEGFFEEFKKYKQDINLGSGEITDSLVFDHITEFSPKIVNFFRNYPKSQFEFKTKSDNVDLLFSVEPAGNVVISWSMNPAFIIDHIEHYTASLDQRLAAAKRCAQAGYKVAFHLDPIIYYPNWSRDYTNLIDRIFDEVDAKQIAWISVGTLRMTPRLKKIIENRFPKNTILNEEFFMSYDGKLRYDQEVRGKIYKEMKETITKKNKDVYVYLCMEEKAMCETAQAAPIKPYRKDR